MTISDAQLNQLYKVQLHDHLDGGIRAQTVIELAQEYGVVLPSSNAEKLSEWFYAESTARSLDRCLAAFSVSCSVMQTEAALERVAFEMMEDMANENVVYIETRFCPYLHRQNGLSYSQIMDSVIRGLELGRQKFGVEYGILVCGIRNFADQVNLEIAQVCCDYLGRGVVGFDFAGADLGFPLIKQIETQKLLKKHNVPLTIHAGEAAGIDAIIEALDFGAARIGHLCKFYQGSDTALITKTLKRLIDQNTHVEINISSNLGTGVVSELSQHPVAKLWHAGVNLSINTDDRIMFANTLLMEYKLFNSLTDVNINDLRKININAMNSSFAAPEVKERCLAKLMSVSA